MKQYIFSKKKKDGNTSLLTSWHLSLQLFKTNLGSESIAGLNNFNLMAYHNLTLKCCRQSGCDVMVGVQFFVVSRKTNCIQK